MSRPLWFIKKCLTEEFENWVNECPDTRVPTITADVFEFLIQIGLLKGKYFNDYIDTLPELHFPEYLELGSLQPLREGYIPPRTWFGRNKKKEAKHEGVQEGQRGIQPAEGNAEAPGDCGSQAEKAAGSARTKIPASGKEDRKAMKITYTLSEDDIKKILADHFETRAEDVQINVPIQMEPGIEIVVTDIQE